MKYTSLLLLILLTVGCGGAASRPSLGQVDHVPDKTYNAYFYTGGPSGYFRAVLLKDPDSGIVITPYSLQIEESKATFDDALKFMSHLTHTGRVNVQSVTHGGKVVGYLLTRPMNNSPFSRGTIDVDLFEQKGALVFSVKENIDVND